MNSDKHNSRPTRGNAMIYILLALALLGLLTMTLMRQNEQNDDLSKDEADIIATKLIANAAAAKNVIDQMIMSGTPAASLDFVIPSEASFNTGSNIHKVFHPAGGGLAFQIPDPKIFNGPGTAPRPGWYMIRATNVEWTPTAANDVLYTALQIPKAVCESINKKITGSTTILPVNTSISELFAGTAHGAASDTNFTTAYCTACSGYPSLCVSNWGATAFAYYNILSAQ